MPRQATLYIYCVTAVGLAMAAASIGSFTPADLQRYLAYLALAILGSMLKVKLPGLSGTISLGFLFVLLAATDLSLGETVTIAAATGLVQTIWRTQKRPSILQVLFNIANLAISAGLAFEVSHLAISAGLIGGASLLPTLALTVAIFFAVNTGLVSGVLALLEDKPFQATWSHWFLWVFPYYFAGAALVAIVDSQMRGGDWRTGLALTSVMYFIYTYYRLYVRAHAPEEYLAVAR
jgi:MASE9 protein